MNSFKKTLLATAVLAAATTTGVAQAEVSANIGVTSDYIWRGVSQSGEAASVSGGIDYADESGFYAGTWVGSLSAEDDDGFGGSEVDLYFGYGGESGAVSYDVGYIYYAYPSQDNTDFGEIYGSVGIGAFSGGLALTTNNGSANDGAQFAEGDLYYHVGVAGDLSADWTIGFTIGGYVYDDPADDGSTLDDYIHYNLDFGTSTDVGDFTFTLFTTDADDEDVRAVVSWGKGF